MATKHQTSFKQNSCKFGRSHGPWTGPIFRNGTQVSPVVDTEITDDWIECATCGRVEDDKGDVVVDPPFERCTN